MLYSGNKSGHKLHAVLFTYIEFTLFNSPFSSCFTLKSANFSFCFISSSSLAINLGKLFKYTLSVSFTGSDYVTSWWEICGNVSKTKSVEHSHSAIIFLPFLVVNFLQHFVSIKHIHEIYAIRSESHNNAHIHVWLIA